ncbi:hypothetical protein EKO27_g4055 [Xylaria grammica]|uniref:Aminoglycoside phosphotransferase domain-containing protein n=1 Tax=Xylaria grammica TaxID=363999 RepID=A0A439D9G9_9PEZI|nr:hypothetical protein EKO27_g4055 [Xylaria grammica]
MTTYTYAKIPYFAPTPDILPTYDEIVARAKESPDWTPGRAVVKIGNYFIAKYGKKINFIEGRNMLLVQEHTTIRIPNVYAMYKHEPSGDNVIIMEYVPGEILQDVYEKLDADKKASVGAQLREQLRELREIPSPRCYGLPAPYGQQENPPYLAHSWIFKKRAGPFDTAAEFLDAYFRAQFSEVSEVGRSEIAYMKSQFMELSKKNDASVFTHADLQPKNIILRKDGFICIIDWESASFCPAYFEFFMHETYRMVSAGLYKVMDNGHFLEYGQMVELIKMVWDTYTTLNYLENS